MRELAAKRVDLVKIWVDDRGGRAPRMPPPVYRAIIDEAHRRGLKVNAHVFYHDDAVGLVEAGIDGLAHLVRDREMDGDLIAAIVRRGVYVMPNLGGAERGTHSTVPAWFEEPGLMTLLRESTPAPVVDRIRASFTSRDASAAKRRANEVHDSSAEPCRAEQGWRADHSWMRHRAGGSSLRLRGAARARGDGGGRHVAGSGDCRRDEPFRRISGPSEHGDPGAGQTRRFHRASRKPPRGHTTDAEHRLRVLRRTSRRPCRSLRKRLTRD